MADEAVIPVLEPYTRYICPRGCWGRWTGAYNPVHRRPDDGLCLIHGVPLVKEPEDDGSRWRLTWEMDSGSGRGWHSVEKETASERDAREQVTGLLTLQAEGEPIRNVALARAVVAWEPVDLAPAGASTEGSREP